MLANDYFGMDMLGYDPYHQQKLDTLARYQTIDQLVGEQAQTGTNSAAQPQVTQPQPQLTTSSSYPNTGVSGIGDLANSFMTTGMGGTYQPYATQNVMEDPGDRQGEMDPTCPPGTIYNNGKCIQWPVPEGGCPPGWTQEPSGGCSNPEFTPTPGTGNPPSQPPPQGPGGTNQQDCPAGYYKQGNLCIEQTGSGAASSIYTNANIPPDIRALREALGGFFTGNFAQQGNPYPGNLYIGGTPYMGQAAQAGAAQAGTSNQYGGLFQNLISQLQGGFPGLQEQLNAIDVQGQGQLQDISAGIRERYGAMGLGAGSDIAEALGRGISRGQADINVAKSNAISSAWEGSQNRLLGAAGVIPGMTTAQSQGYAGYGNLLAQLGMMDLGIQEGNITRPYNAWLQQQEYPFMNYALGLATGFPPNPNPKPVVQGGSGFWSGLAGLAGSLGSAAILASSQNLKTNITPLPYGNPYPVFSDRNGKRDVVPYKGSVLAALRELKISTWQYKGDNVVHIGPMAQDMKRLFGVGDGKTIHLVDVVGILMAAAKEMADAKA